jgi:hypothetical protein
MTEPPRRFPPPWRSDKMPGGYVVRDTTGQAIAYLYSRENEAEARQAKVLTADEARRIAAKGARPMPERHRSRATLGAAGLILTPRPTAHPYQA